MNSGNLPVVVLVQTDEINEAEFSASFPIPKSTQWRYEPIGIIGECGTRQKELAKLNEELASFGVEAKLCARAVNGKPGYVGVLVFYGVQVSTVDDAKKLPNFVQFFAWSGYQYTVPLLVELAPRGVNTEHGIEQLDAPVNDENYAPPDFNGKDAVEVSCLPLGRIESLVFLKDKPQFIYRLSGNQALVAGRIDDVKQFALIRESQAL